MTHPTYGRYDNLKARYARIAAAIPKLVPDFLAKGMESNFEGFNKGLRFKFEGHGEIDIDISEDLTHVENVRDDAENEFVRFTLKFGVTGPTVNFDSEKLDVFIRNLSNVRDVLNALEDQFLGPVYEFYTSKESRAAAELQREVLNFKEALAIDERVIKMRTGQVIELDTKLHDTAFEMRAGRNLNKCFMVTTTKSKAQITRTE